MEYFFYLQLSTFPCGFFIKIKEIKHLKLQTKTIFFSLNFKNFYKLSKMPSFYLTKNSGGVKLINFTRNIYFYFLIAGAKGAKVANFKLF